jgi:hypothetical protein
MTENEKVVNVKVVDDVTIREKKESETGKYLIDVSKIVLAVLVVDNVVTNKLANSLTLFFIGLGMSFCLFVVGNLLNNRR